MHKVAANGASIPALGFGTWDLRETSAVNMVRGAIEIGYRHIDTAVMYDNEAEVGEGIRQSGIDRDDLFLTTKIWPTEFEPTAFAQAVEQSLGRLGVDYVDLLLLHWPNPDIAPAQTLSALSKAKHNGQTRHIGISNFTGAMVDEAVSLCDEPIAVNQVEYHPYLNQDTLVGIHNKHGIALTAYCPIARGRIFKDPVLLDIAKKYQRNAGQITLRWLIQQQNVIAVPRTSSLDHARSNFDIFDFELDASDMDQISSCASDDGRIVAVNNNGFAPAWD